MYTRCPTCQTYFRVSREQLQASSGQVRCVRCQSVFDAFATLSAQPPTAARAKPVSVSAREGDTPGAGTDAETGAHTQETEQPQREAEVRGVPPGNELLTLPDNLFGAKVAGETSGHKWTWIAGSMLLALALGLQAMIFFGSEVAAALPSTRPALTQACQWLGCHVRLARIPDQLFIEASDMQLLHPARVNEVLLTATIRNRAALAQELPLLEVTITDPLNQTAARKVFYPSQYLDKSFDAPTSLGPNQEILVKLYLNTSDIKPTGYRLYLFFA